MSDTMKQIIQRFLNWKLPKDFGPDAGITFKTDNAYEGPHWPVGTNLLTYDQVEAMLRDIGIAKLVEQVETLKAELDRIRRMAGTGSVKNWLKLSDEEKAKCFAMMVRESSRRKEAEAERDALRKALEQVMHPALVQAIIDSVR
jgi:hypothetical protein